jgi:hypothetical protein
MQEVLQCLGISKTWNIPLHSQLDDMVEQMIFEDRSGALRGSFSAAEKLG